MEHKNLPEKNRLDINVIRTEFSMYKEATDEKFDEILDKLKPQFTPAQITTFVVALMGYMVGVMLYLGGMNNEMTKGDTETQKLEIRVNHLEKEDAKKDLQYEVIDLKLETLLTSVAVLNEYKENGTNK